MRKIMCSVEQPKTVVCLFVCLSVIRGAEYSEEFKGAIFTLSPKIFIGISVFWVRSAPHGEKNGNYCAILKMVYKTLYNPMVKPYDDMDYLRWCVDYMSR